MPDRTSASPWRRDSAVLAAVSVAFFGYLAVHRIVDDDEGYYALAGRAFTEGRVLYRDLFFPQMPLTAMVYGTAQAVLGRGIVPLRWFVAACGVVTALLVQHAARRVGGKRAGLVAAALFLGHTLVWEWAPTVKTIPLGMLLGTAALVVATSRVVTPRRALLAGLLAGLAVAARALSLPITVAVVLGLLGRRRASPSGGRWALLAAAGFALGMVPALVYVALDPAAFWFDNVRYHALRSPGDGLVKDLGQKLDAARAVFLSPWGATRPDVTGLQTSALLGAAVVGFFRSTPPSIVVAEDADPARGGPEGRALQAPFLVAAGLAVAVSLLPSPVWVQYFALAIPPASVVVGVWLASFGGSRWPSVAVAGVYLAVAWPSFRDRLVLQPGALRPAALDEVGRALDGVTREGDAVAAHWPSYLAASRRRPLAAAENQFARLFSDRVSDGERRRFHLYTEDELREALLRGDARAFVVGTFVVPETGLALKAGGWARGPELLGATLWLPPTGAP
jgi:4-amino-4-deoxy-L-arabinose transferase-like glycosyltransferase